MSKVCLAIVLVYISTACYGQKKSACDESFPYVDHNFVDYDLKASNVRFTVIWPDGAPMEKACAGVFDEQSHKLLAVGESSKDGRVEFSCLKPGRYRLVVADPQRVLCSANTRLIVTRSGVNRFFVNMRGAGIDTCSWCGEKKIER